MQISHLGVVLILVHIYQTGHEVKEYSAGEQKDCGYTSPLGIQKLVRFILSVFLHKVSAFDCYTVSDISLIG